MRYIVFLFAFILFLSAPLRAEAPLAEVLDKSAEFKALLLAGKYKDLTYYLDDFLSAHTKAKDGSNYLVAIIENIFSKKASDRELQVVTKWCEDDQTSAWARILRAEYFLRQLERFPASEFHKTKIDSLLQKFIDEAASDSEIAVRLARDNVAARYMHLKIARFQKFKNDYQKRFDVIAKLYPQHFQSYLERLKQLSPQWGGSARDLINFSKQTALSVDKLSVLKSLPLFAHKLMAEQSKDPKKYLSSKIVLEEMQEAERLTSEAFPKSGRYLELFSKLAKLGGYLDLAQRAHFQAMDREN